MANCKLKLFNQEIMLKKLMSITLATIIALVAVATPSFVAPNQSSALAAVGNTIVLEVSSSKDDLDDLRYGEGKLFKRIASTVEDLKDAGEIDEDAQPVIIVVKKKTSRSW